MVIWKRGHWITWLSLNSMLTLSSFTLSKRRSSHLRPFWLSGCTCLKSWRGFISWVTFTMIWSLKTSWQNSNHQTDRQQVFNHRGKTQVNFSLLISGYQQIYMMLSVLNSEGLPTLLQTTPSKDWELAPKMIWKAFCTYWYTFSLVICLGRRIFQCSVRMPCLVYRSRTW